MVILGLGSNHGDRAGYLAAAVTGLARHVSGLRCSRVLECPAMLPEGAPAEWDSPFYNMAVSGETLLSPQELLLEIKKLERELGRVARGVWSPREIDIDILAMDDLVMEIEGLSIPHPGLCRRDFVLLPVMEVAPEWRYPLPGAYYGMTAGEMAAAQGFALGPQLREAGIALNG